MAKALKRDNLSTFAVEYQKQYEAVACSRRTEAVVKVNILNLFIYSFIHLFIYLFISSPRKKLCIK